MRYRNQDYEAGYKAGRLEALKEAVKDDDAAAVFIKRAKKFGKHLKFTAADTNTVEISGHVLVALVGVEFLDHTGDEPDDDIGALDIEMEIMQGSESSETPLGLIGDMQADIDAFDRVLSQFC